MAQLPTLSIMRTDDSSTFISQDAPGKDFAKWVRRPGMYDTKYNITGTFDDTLWRADLAEWNLKAQESKARQSLLNQDVTGFVVVVKYLTDEGIPDIYSTADSAKTTPLTFTTLSAAPMKGTDSTNAPSAIGTYNWAIDANGLQRESCYWTEAGQIATEANGGARVRGRRVMVSKIYVAIPTTIEDPDFGDPGHPVQFIQVNPSPTL
jgi:hypothetical protein